MYFDFCHLFCHRTTIKGMATVATTEHIPIIVSMLISKMLIFFQDNIILCSLLDGIIVSHLINDSNSASSDTKC